MKSILITGSNGLIGSTAVKYFCEHGHNVHGIDNNFRELFFGKDGSTQHIGEQLTSSFDNFKLFKIDIRDREQIRIHFNENEYDLVIHAAAQPSHDKAAQIPHLDFETNAIGTLNLLQEFKNRNTGKEVFVLLSTNKVYGDRPNLLPLQELENRFDFSGELYKKGIDEKLSVDQTKHSLFGVSKLSADLLTQEYGKYFNIKTIILRGGCLTGPNHSSVPLHGFLSYLIKTCKNNDDYTIFGYKGKQVRDQIHAEDVAIIIERLSSLELRGEVFNLGGGFANSASLNELVSYLQTHYGTKPKMRYSEEARSGDHICYYSNLDKLRSFIPNFKLKYDLPNIIEDIFNSV